MKIKEVWRKIWEYLKKDTWDSWLVSLILVFVFIKLIFFPLLSLVTGSSLPLVVVESCSMYHETNFDDWWFKNSAWYEQRGISKSDFEGYPFKDGLNKGDILLLISKDKYKRGDIIVYPSSTAHPIIHRIVTENPITTKGDHNPQQYSFDVNVPQNNIIGKTALKVPLFGWVKLIFFEPFRPKEERGFCS
ncbi:hypothetical protein J4229_02310 [Candidatus Pacearchaeota archaeon]|nr:hypothetical protein [Candidatus Pacearchaeota archaeon]